MNSTARKILELLDSRGAILVCNAEFELQKTIGDLRETCRTGWLLSEMEQSGLVKEISWECYEITDAGRAATADVPATVKKQASLF